MLLAKQTAHLLIKDGNTLVTLVDRATRAIAEGDTLGDDPRSKKKFEEAAAHLRSYVSKTQEFLARGNVARETAALLIEQATTLMKLVEARALAARLLPKGRQSDGSRALHLGGEREHGFLALRPADDLKADGQAVAPIRTAPTRLAVRSGSARTSARSSRCRSASACRRSSPDSSARPETAARPCTASAGDRTVENSS